MIESYPIPPLARTALSYEMERHEQSLLMIGAQTLEVLGFTACDGFDVNFGTGFITRALPDVSSDAPGVA